MLNCVVWLFFWFCSAVVVPFVTNWEWLTCIVLCWLIEVQRFKIPWRGCDSRFMNKMSELCVWFMKNKINIPFGWLDLLFAAHSIPHCVKTINILWAFSIFNYLHWHSIHRTFNIAIQFCPQNGPWWYIYMKQQNTTEEKEKENNDEFIKIKKNKI